MQQYYRLINSAVVFFIVVFFLPSFVFSESEKPKIYTVNYPLMYFAERIGSEFVEIHFPAPPDIDPAFWKPSMEIIKEYQNADLIMINGAGYAKWLDLVSLPISKIADTSEEFKDKYIKIRDTTTHSHGPKGEHSHTGYASTTWLDPDLAIMQAEAVKNAVQKLLPEHKEKLDSNFEQLKKELQDLGNALQNTFSSRGDIFLIASHPVYQYLSSKYNLGMISMHLEPHEVLTESGLEKIRKLTKENKRSLMIWENTPLVESVEKMDNIGVESTVFNPCGNKPENGDYLTIMQENVKNLEQSFELFKP